MNSSNPRRPNDTTNAENAGGASRRALRTLCLLQGVSSTSTNPERVLRRREAPSAYSAFVVPTEVSAFVVLARAHGGTGPRWSATRPNNRGWRPVLLYCAWLRRIA